MCPVVCPTRAFLYARSAGSQIAPTAKVDDQLRRLKTYAQNRSYIVVGAVYDLGASGNHLSRPGLAVVMDGTTSTPPAFDVLLVTDRTRLARGVVFCHELMPRLKAAGVKIETPDDSPSMHNDEISIVELVGQDDED